MLLAIVAGVLADPGCSTAPKVEDRAALVDESASATAWFERSIPGLREQIDGSAGYIIYPSVGQWGTLFTGGQYGRGVVSRPDGTQVGWAAINTGSLGLQAGVRGFKMLVVFEDEAALDLFRQDRLSGSISGVVVVAEEGMSTKAPFERGVAIYQGASTGLMAGVNVGLSAMRYEPM
jgi:lipid-binding SYLF domain-containing protein